MNESILVVEDDQALRATLTDRLRGEGYVVDTAPDGHEAYEKVLNLPFDLIILDLMLPGRSGLDVCREIRQAGMATPILMLTARNQTVDKVVGLRMGADDYVTKPFEAAELIARIDVLLRRVPIHTGQGIHEFGPIRVDVRRSEVTRDEKPVYLSAREFQLLPIWLKERAERCPEKNCCNRSGAIT
jgi:two-component system, OmpR family, alkaline phosphatase synthesis response regulator PhoP